MVEILLMVENSMPYWYISISIYHRQRTFENGSNKILIIECEVSNVLKKHTVNYKIMCLLIVINHFY
jgi:hypothetical protein